MVINKRAFSIIELLVVIGMVGILTTVAIASYNGYAESQKLVNEVNKFKTVLSLAQKRAISGDVGDCTSSPGCTLNYFNVNWVSSTQYSMNGNRHSNSSNLDETFDQTTFAIDTSNKNIIMTANFGIVPFSKLTGGVNANYNVIFQNTATSTCTQVGVTTAGLINSSATTCP